MPNPEEVPPLPDFINQSALETQGNEMRDFKKTNTRMKMMMMMIGGQWGGGGSPPLLEYNH